MRRLRSNLLQLQWLLGYVYCVQQRLLWRFTAAKCRAQWHNVPHQLPRRVLCGYSANLPALPCGMLWLIKTIHPHPPVIAGVPMRASQSCGTCTGATPSDCSSCDGTYHGNETHDEWAQTYLLNSHCVATCPSGYAVENNVCIRCSSTCATCTIPGDAHACTACDPSSRHPYLEAAIINSTTVARCVTSCTVPATFPNVAAGTCEACHPDCASCSGPAASQCTLCASASTTLVNGNCVVVSTNIDDGAAYASLQNIASLVTSGASSGTLDLGVNVLGLSIGITAGDTTEAAGGTSGVDNATDAVTISTGDSLGEVQRLEIAGAPLSGNITMSFNGEHTRSFSLADLRPGTYQSALEALRTIGSVDVTYSTSLIGNATVASGTATGTGDAGTYHRLDIEFTMLGSPSNRGAQPLISARTEGFHGTTTVERTRHATTELNLTSEEQTLAVSLAACGNLSLSFYAESTGDIAVPPAAMDVRDALVALSTIGDVEVHMSTTSTAFEYRVRFLPTAHIGPQPLLSLNTSGLVLCGGGSGESALQVGALARITLTAPGGVPLDGAEAVVNRTESLVTTAVVYVPPTVVCGDGSRGTGEECDDGHTQGGDGCSPFCTIEAGWTCVSSSGGSGLGGLDTCTPICGDGIRVLANNAEGCDDNNTFAGDGCSSACNVELGYECTGGGPEGPDICSQVCGDGVRSSGEVCDDGGQLSGDGCSPDCQSIESGYSCAVPTGGATTVCAPCHASCLECTGPAATQCTSCAMSAPFQHGSRCLASCTPEGMWPLTLGNHSSCQPCDSSCNTCSGGSANSCLTCPVSDGSTRCLSLRALSDGSQSQLTALRSHAITQANRPYRVVQDSGVACTATCPVDTFPMRQGDQWLCAECHQSCGGACISAHSYGCTSCNASSPLYALDLVSESAGRCVIDCPDGKYLAEDNATCVECNATCATCSGPSSEQCTSCIGDGGNSALIDGRCVSTCGTGTYFVESYGFGMVAGQGTCEPCSSSCQTCAGTPEHCTSCPNTHFFINATNE